MITEQILLAKAMEHKDAQEAYDWFSNSEYDWETGKYTENPALPETIKLVFAEYEQAHYEGSAIVIGYNTENEQWFMVRGGHCSCYGLEGQWDEEYCTFDELLVAVKKETHWDDEFGLVGFFEIEKEAA